MTADELIALGLVHQEKGEHGAAAAAFTSAAEAARQGAGAASASASLAWLHLGRLALVALDGEDEWGERGADAAERLLDEGSEAPRVLLLAREARAAGKRNGAMVALEQVLARDPDHAEAAAMWFEIALDELDQFEQVVDMAESLVEEEPERAARFLEEVLRRQPGREDARAVQELLRAERERA